jgi:hypothetical protein
MTPFTYYLYHKPTGKKYYGVRTAKGCCPSDLWTKYFSSSTVVHDLIKEYGMNSFEVEVRKVFDNKRDAILWERNVLIRLKASKSDLWLNKHNGGGAGSHTEQTRKKIAKNNSRYWQGKKRPELSEKLKGHEVSEVTKDKIRKSLKGIPLKEETKLKMKGRIPWNKGLKLKRENA